MYFQTKKLLSIVGRKFLHHKICNTIRFVQVFFVCTQVSGGGGDQSYIQVWFLNRWLQKYFFIFNLIFLTFLNPKIRWYKFCFCFNL